MDYVEVSLEPYEFSLAVDVGVRRQMAAVLTGKRDKYGIDPEGGWGVHIEGACGEMAVAKYLDRYWNGSVNTFRLGGDVGDLQVRTRSHHDYDLLIREADRAGDTFVLVTGQAPHFRIHGWIEAAEARQPRWLKAHGQRGQAWFVPQSELRTIDSLKRHQRP